MEEENKPQTTEEQSSSGEKMPPPPTRQDQATIERAEEQKLRAKYPQANKPMLPTGGGPAGMNYLQQGTILKLRVLFTHS